MTRTLMQPERSCMYVHICAFHVCIFTVVHRLTGRRKSKKKASFSFPNIASKMPHPRSSRQFPSGGWGQRPPPRLSITRCELQVSV